VQVPIVETSPTTSASASASASAPTTTRTSSAAASTGGASSGPPVAIVPDDPNEPGDQKLQAATKLIKTGKHADLLAARKLLGTSVFAGTGTSDQARLLRLVCSKLGDKPCVARCAQFIK
jgi:hypothetical protein